MPRINITEHSETYSFQVKNNNYATIALPIAAIWGPSYIEGDEDANPDWVYFPAGYRGTTEFMQTFRGANTYLGAREKSFDYCLKLLAAGYDILVKRVDGLGNRAKYEAYVPKVGTSNTAKPASTQIIFQQAVDTMPDLDQSDVTYIFYDPYVSGTGANAKILWENSHIADHVTVKSVQKVYNQNTKQWDFAVSSKLIVETKDAAEAAYVVEFNRPTVEQLTSDAIVNTQEITLTEDGETATGMGKKRVVSGTIQVVVKDLRGTVLETRNISVTEEYIGYGAEGSSSSTNETDEVRITGLTMPEFTYINITAFPPMLLFKSSGAGWNGKVYLGCYDNSGTATPLTADVAIAATAEDACPKIVAGSGTNASVQQIRVIPGTVIDIPIYAKYPGSFGNNLKVRIKCSTNTDGEKIGVVEVYDNNGHTGYPNQIVPTDQLLEIVSVAFEETAASDSQPLLSEATFTNLATIPADCSELPVGEYVFSLYQGTDYALYDTEGAAIVGGTVQTIVRERFDNDGSTFCNYIDSLVSTADTATLIRLYNQQMLYKRFYECVGELTDPIVYDWDALFCGIADDQYVPKSYLAAHPEFTMEYEVTKIMTKMIEVASASKCGCAFIGTPFGMPRGIQIGTGTNAIKTGALKFKDDLSSAVGTVYSTFGQVVGPWCKTTLPLGGANSWITPEVGHLLLIIAAQGVGGMNKWWMVPAGMLGSGIVHSPEYKVKKAYLDLIQDHDEGVCLNPLMEVPGKGFTCFGNSTLWNKPLGTYNALQNLSTRFLTNRVKQRIWNTALQILFKYNNENAYSHFYAGLSPLLDEMRSVGALTGNEHNPWGYRIIMNPDIINLDRINANTVIGKVELAVTGVIDTVDVDLFLLPPTGFQETYD